MSTYQLEQTGQQVQNILNEAPQTKLDLQSEIIRAEGKEGELAQAIANEKTRAEGIEGGLRTDLNAEIQRATDKDVVLENAIGAEKTRAEGVEGGLRTDVDAIDAKIPTQASSSNQLADKAFVNSSIATNTADFKGTYNSLEQLETEVTDANANDYAFVIGTDQAGNTVYNRYKYVEGIGWEFEYALNNSSFTAAQWAAINSAITAALVAKLTGLPTAEALTTSLNDLLTAIGAEKTRAEGIEGGLRTDVNANAGAIVTEKNRAEGVEGTLTNGLSGEILNRSNADTALGLRIDGEATLRENADSALQGDIDDINDLIPTQASESNQLADKEFVNSSIATNTAEFKGTYNSLEELAEAVTDANANDYAFIVGTDAAGNTVYNRYKYVEGTGWVFEYALNNSSFTSAQWAAINSSITAALVTKLSGLPTNDALNAMFAEITALIPSAASSENKLVDAAQFIAALATKQDTLSFDSVPTENSANPVTSGGLYDMYVELVTAITALQSGKQDTLTFDSTPTAGSTNPVTSQGVKGAIDSEAALRISADNLLDSEKADKATTLAGYGITDAYTKSETYNKTEVNGLVSTPHQNYVTVATYASLPASGSADTIYRVSSYDGANSQVDDTVYSEYAWDGTQYVFLCVKSQIDEVFDITVYNSNTKYADLAAALGTNGANIPQSLRRGGMSVKFVQSSDNKYVEYFLTKNTWSASKADWEKVNLEEEVDDIKTKIGNVEISWEKGTYYQTSSESPGYEKVLTTLNYETAVVDMSGRDGNSFRAYLSTGLGTARVFVLDTNGNKLLVYSSVNNLIDFVLPSNVGQVLLTNRYSDVLFPKVFVSDTAIPSVATMKDLSEAERRLNPILNNLKDAKVSFIGDSITEGYYASEASKRYCNVFCSKYGAIVNNLGIASTSIANNTLNEMSAYRFVTRATVENLADSKLIVVFGGTNDFTYDSKAIGDLFRIEPITPDGYVGNKEKLAITDTDTFAGALHELINTIRTNCPNVPIVFITPLKRGFLSGNPKRPKSHQANQWGDYMDDFCTAIKEICAYYSIPVLDANACSELDFVNSSIANEYSQDNLHPNDKGHAIIAELLFRFVEKNVVIL